MNITDKKPFNVGYIVAGYPSLAYTKEFLTQVDESQLDVLEIGIPYSDPLADGKVIAKASFTAVQDGVVLDNVFDLLAETKTETPLVFLIYYNLIFSYGEDAFVKRAQEVGLSGVIIPDLPYEEAAGFSQKLKTAHINMIPLISITSNEERIAKILSQGSGFVYAIGALGITGSKTLSEKRLKELQSRIRKHTDLPIAIGFGVKTKSDVATMRNIFDGVIVGTKIVEYTKKESAARCIKKIDQLFQ